MPRSQAACLHSLKKGLKGQGVACTSPDYLLLRKEPPSWAHQPTPPRATEAPSSEGGRAACKGFFRKPLFHKVTNAPEVRGRGSWYPRLPGIPLPPSEEPGRAHPELQGSVPKHPLGTQLDAGRPSSQPSQGSTHLPGPQALSQDLGPLSQPPGTAADPGTPSTQP